MFKKILVVVILVVCGFVIFVSTRPDESKVTRSITIAAPPSAIFPHVDDPREFQKWSPWAKMDPQAKIAYTGPAEGVGSSFSWAGGKTGEGTMTQTVNLPDQALQFRLEFRKPFEGTNTVDFTFRPEGATTAVTWTMVGKSNFLFKAMGIFMDCDAMVGKDFEKGLADLKTLSEAKP